MYFPESAKGAVGFCYLFSLWPCWPVFSFLGKVTEAFYSINGFACEILVNENLQSPLTLLKVIEGKASLGLHVYLMQQSSSSLCELHVSA